MLNTNVKVDIKPACIGTLQKSHPKSYFYRFHKASSYAKKLFEGCMDVQILQIMVFGDNEFLAELISDKDYENTMKGGES